MAIEWRCLYCNEALSRAWMRPDQKYCGISCKNSYWYQKKYKPRYAAKYQKIKQEWERSPTGKRAGVPIGQWRAMPKDWR